MTGEAVLADTEGARVTRTDDGLNVALRGSDIRLGG